MCEASKVSYRPDYHFSPKANCLNVTNGSVNYVGNYYLFLESCNDVAA